MCGGLGQGATRTAAAVVRRHAPCQGTGARTEPCLPSPASLAPGGAQSWAEAAQGGFPGDSGSGPGRAPSREHSPFPASREAGEQGPSFVTCASVSAEVSILFLSPLPCQRGGSQ